MPGLSPTNQDASPLDQMLTEYDQVMHRLFEELHIAYADIDRLPFTKADIERAVDHLGLAIKNVPDIVYTYRSGRSTLPQSILARGNWAIDGLGKGKYVFVRLTRSPYVDIPSDIEAIRILDATPQIVLKYQGTDEQSILGPSTLQPSGRYVHCLDRIPHPGTL